MTSEDDTGRPSNITRYPVCDHYFPRPEFITIHFSEIKQFATINIITNIIFTFGAMAIGCWISLIYTEQSEGIEWFYVGIILISIGIILALFQTWTQLRTWRKKEFLMRGPHPLYYQTTETNQNTHKTYTLPPQQKNSTQRKIKPNDEEITASTQTGQLTPNIVRLRESMVKTNEKIDKPPPPRKRSQSGRMGKEEDK